jgi:VWFA-related protein
VQFRRIFRGLASAFLLLAAFLHGQTSSSNASPYLLRIQHVTDGEQVCALLRRDGQYHFERSSAVYEGALPPATLTDLQNALDTDELTHLTQAAIPLPIVSYHRDEVELTIARGTTWQLLHFVDAGSRKPFHQSLDPVMKWLDGMPPNGAFRLSEDQAANNCLPPETNRVTLSSRASNDSQTAAKPAALTSSTEYLMRILLDQIGPGEVDRTCVVVYPSGKYHAEKGSQKYNLEAVYKPDNADLSVAGRAKAAVYEQTLDPSALQNLRDILNQQPLKDAQHDSLPFGKQYTDADITFLSIPRDRSVQRLTFSSYFAVTGAQSRMNAGGTSNRHIDSEDDLLTPIRKWMKANVNANKDTRQKNLAGNNCAPGAAPSALTEAELAENDFPGEDTSTPASGAAAAPASGPLGSSPQTDNYRPAQNDQPAEPAISIRVTTRMVVMDFVATDSKGKPVTDLKPDDISILENGKPEKIALLTPPSENAANTPSRPPRPVPANIFSNRPQDHQPSGPLILLLLDGLNTAAQDQAYAKQQMLSFVRTLKPDQKVAIFALAGNLFLLQDFTSDPAALAQALEKFKAQDSAYLSRGQPALLTGTMAAMLAESPLLENLNRFNQESAVNSTNDRVRLTAAALKAIARAMIGYPGRKNLIWISSGFPASLDFQGRYSYLSQDYVPDVNAAGALLSQAQIALYTVDARGLVGGVVDQTNQRFNQQMYGARAIQTPAGEVVPTVASSGQPSFGTSDMTRTGNELTGSHLVMENLAKETGGEAFYNANNLDLAMSKSVADGTTYYTLGYYPENKDWDGKFRKINIKTSRPDVKVRAREGYFALDASTQSGAQALNQQDRARELSLAMTDPMPATGVAFRVRVQRSSDSPSQLLVQFQVDPNSVSFKEAGQGRHDSNLDFAAFAVSRDGKIVDTVVKNVNTPLPVDQYTLVQKRGLPFKLEIKAPESKAQEAQATVVKSVADKSTVTAAPGSEGSLFVAVRDNHTGLLGTLRVPLPVKDVPAAPQAANANTPDKTKPQQ